MKINLGVVREQIFANPTVRARIIRDYGLDFEPSNPDEFASEVVGQFDQAAVPDPAEQQVSNQEVFRAAVKAIGSNSRSWATFLRGEPQLADMLGGYDPAETQRRVASGRIGVEQVKSYLPGQSSGGDARAILQWSELLTDVPGYYGRIRDLAHAFRALGQEKLDEALSDAEVLLCIAGFLGSPPTRWAGTKYLPRASEQVPPSPWKLPGMGYILTSEFLRNLHWNGFKPDRHVQRLFDRWFPSGLDAVRPRTNQLLQLFGRDAQDLRTYLAYSLLGIAASPPGVTYSHVDNLVWLLGAYVEKKGKESAIVYTSPEDGNEPPRGDADQDTGLATEAGRAQRTAARAVEDRPYMADGHGSMTGAVRAFAHRFSEWSITLPPEDVQHRRRGEIREQGWRIQYVFGSVGGVEFLDYYASHRITGDTHARIYENSEIEALPVLADRVMYPADAGDDERERIRREHHQRNASTARLLHLKRFM